jgi:hypothetical protein
MRTALFLAAVTVASVATAQIPLPAFGSTYTAAATRGFWFTSPASFVITGLRVPNEAAQAFQAVEVIDLGASAPPAYPGTIVGTQLFYNNSTAAGNIIPCSIVIAANANIGILGACTASVGNPTSYNSYAGTSGPFASTILGNPVTLTRFGTQSGISSNGGNQPVWQEAAFQVSRVEIFIATPTGFATASPYGTGCYDRHPSFYESFGSASAFDLANSSLSMIYAGNGYTVLPGFSSFVAPSGSATTVANGDDVEQTVTLGSTLNFPGGSTSALTICSNGFVSAASNGTSYTPGSAAFLAFAQACWALGWHDLNPSAAGSGPIQFEEVGSVSYFTWNGVWDFAGTSTANANTMQIQFDRSSGNVHMIWQTMSTLGNGFLTGFKPAGTVADPGNRDISATLPGTFSTGPDQFPLALAASARPIVNTSINLVTSNVPASSSLGATILSFTQHNPGLDLGSIGMPGCRQYVGLDASNVFIPSGGTGTIALGVPNNPALSGLHVFSQSAAFVVGANALGVQSSNGLALTIGIN